VESRIVFAMYKPHDGKENELKGLLKKHFPVLREYGLITERVPLIVKSGNGTYIEIFEWESEESVNKAHDHPAVADIWEKMAQISEFSTMSKLTEVEGMFPHFEPVPIH